MIQNDKAYKLLALQEGISNRAAKELIDRGAVYAAGKKILLARADMKANTVFKIEKLKKPEIIFEDDKITAVNKPPFLTSEEVAQSFKLTLLHRLDKETSGVLLLSKDDEFTKKVIATFKAQKVVKTYLAVVSGRFAQSVTIDTPLQIMKTKSGAYAKPSKDGQSALSTVTPKFIEGKNSLVEVSIQTGRTHQIRAHLKSIGFPVMGDEKYGGKSASRIMLHAWKISLLGYSFESPLTDDFAKFGKSV
ncbi:MAG: RluA family pseudouridine synthase [Campylobacteraceae bacterium]|jgi:23S rRNA-/tRNA-specific pseudouridylate synthase|nr:RluA family pseudouridine synthase [Campylobacteraceae bacterium]